MNPHQIIQRLEQIEQDCASRQAKGEQQAERFYRAKRDYELEYAKAYMDTTGTPTERKMKTTKHLASHESYRRLLEAEGAFEGWRAVMRTLELRTSIGQSLLRAQREVGA